MIAAHELAELVAQMKSLGILHLKTADVEILLGAGHLPAPQMPRGQARKAEQARASQAASLEKDLLFAATEGYPE